MLRLTVMCAALMFAGTSFVHAQAIAGNWRTAKGAIASIAKCGPTFCITLKSGKFKGRSIGKMSGSGASYKGTITDPEKNKTYSGTASVKGRSLLLSGCVMGIFCRSQTWSRR